MATAVERCGLGTPDQAQDAATRAVTLPVDHPRPVPVREMVAGLDLDELATSCAALYGRRGSHRVDENACRQDARRIAAEYEQAQQPLPRDIAGDPMTPSRVLTVLYSNEGLTHGAPAAWTDLRTRLLNRGADRTVLVALVAWARHDEGSTASKRLYAGVARLWSQTEERLPALGELHAAVDEARQPPRAA